MAPPPRIVAVINEDWFFASHFLPWAVRARARGFDITVLTRAGEAAGRISAAGIAVVPALAHRGGVLPRGLAGAAGQLRDLALNGRPTIVHAFGLHGMAIAAMAGVRRLGVPLVCSITGLGYLAARRDPMGRSMMWAMGRVLRAALDGPATVWLAENGEDGPRLGLQGAEAEGRLVRLAGAGVDLEAFPSQPLPDGPGLKLLMVARMVRSKGVDLAVEAVGRAIAAGTDVSLTLVGAPDEANPRAYGRDELEGFAARPGIAWLGARSDVAALMRDHHAFILPSRGGEGLPKALLEAAASGRAAIVSDVPGCRDAVIDGVTGAVVPVDDPEALAGAIVRLARADLTAMGRAARARIEAAGGVEAVADQVIAVYCRLASVAASRNVG